MVARLLLVLMMFAPLAAWANGGPVQLDYTATARGNVVPLHVKDVRLISEKLTIQVLRGGNSYRVTARYRVHNPRARRLLFGVPLGWGDEGTGDYTPNEQDERRQRYIDRAARSVHLVVGGVRYACRVPDAMRRYRNEEKPDPLDIMPLRKLRVDNVTREPLRDPNSLKVSESLGQQVWCLSRIHLPEGEVPIRLSYRGHLEHWSDWKEGREHHKHPFRYRARTFFSPRYLRYVLYPAGYWQGPAKQLEIEVDPGPYRGLAKAVMPAGAVHRQETLRWRLENADLQQMGALVVRFDGRTLFRWRELSRWNGLKQTLALRARSSEGRPQLAVDGDPSTAWCTSSREAWIEVRATSFPRLKTAPNRDGCALRDVLLLPGRVRDAHGLVLDRQVSKIRVEPCGGGDGVTIQLPTGTNPAQIRLCDWCEGVDDNPFFQRKSGVDRRPAAILVNKTEPIASLLKSWKFCGRAEGQKPGCLRITVLNPEGKQACLSELSPMLDCHAGCE